MRKVYIAGKLNDDAVGYIKNMHNMMTYANFVRRKGFAVFVPCLDLLTGLLDGYFTYEDYFNNNQVFLTACDFVFVCPGYQTSKGTLREITLAESLGIPVFYQLEELDGKQ